MDSKQLVNDIVNKKFSKARDTIREELANRIVDKTESMGPEVIHEALGLIKKAGLAIGGGIAAYKLGKKLHKRFGIVGRSKAKEEKEKRKKEKGESKRTLAWLKGPAKDIKKLESELHKPGRGIKLSDKEEKDNETIRKQMSDIKDDFDAEWGEPSEKKPKPTKSKPKPVEKLKPAEKSATEEQIRGQIETLKGEKEDNIEKLRAAEEKGEAGSDEVEDLISTNARIDRDIGKLKSQLPSDEE